MDGLRYSNHIVHGVICGRWHFDGVSRLVFCLYDGKFLNRLREKAKNRYR